MGGRQFANRLPEPRTAPQHAVMQRTASPTGLELAALDVRGTGDRHGASAWDARREAPDVRRPRVGRPKRAYQAPAVLASVMPWDSSQRSASMAALHPSAAAVTAWRYRWSWTSPAMKTPSIFEPVSSWT